MNYQYLAYTRDKKLVKGKLSATSEEAATTLLTYGGYQLVKLQQVVPFFNLGKLTESFTRVKPTEIIMFSRQLALLLESGTDIVTSLELLQAQVTNNILKRVIGEVAADIRGGNSLSVALSKHPQVFSTVYHRAIAAGEHGGSLEVALRHISEYIQRGATTQKKVKNALTYPVVVVVVAIVVIAILVTTVLPSFVGLYTSFGVELPLATRILISITDWFSHYGFFLLILMVLGIVSSLAYIKTPVGKYQKDKLLLNLPVVGRINLLSELSCCCRTMALLFRVGLPLPEILMLAIQGTNNKVMARSLTEVRHQLIRGEGLSKPMAVDKVFLPLMVQMVGVGEETGNLDRTLPTVAEAYEIEADDRTNSAVGLVQPIMTVVIGGIIAFIALALVSAMYSIYGQVGF